MSDGRTPDGQDSAGQDSVDQASAEQVHSDQAWGDQSLGDQLSAGQADADQTPAGMNHDADAMAEPGDVTDHSNTDDDSSPNRAPVTGNHQVDQVLQRIGQLDGLSVGERLERLSAAHQELSQILEGKQPMPAPGGQTASQHDNRQTGN